MSFFAARYARKKAQAEEWEQHALEKIAYHFRECNAERAELARS